MLKAINDLPLIAFFATGGTIAMKHDAQSAAPIPAVSAEGILVSVPGIESLARLQVNDLFNIPSDYMNSSRWIELHQAVTNSLLDPKLTGVVITHGTDTLEETAYFLDLTIDSDKPVVLVGAQRNASECDSDGPRNVRSALRVAVAPESRGQGVLVVMNGQIHAARDVTKSHTSNIDGFHSGEVGCLGLVDGDRVRFYRSVNDSQHIPLQKNQLSNVEIIAMYAGADGSMINAAILSGARGIVVQALGCGNVNEAMYAAIKRAIENGIAVVISTRVLNGRVEPIYGFVGGGNSLWEAGAIFAGNLSPQKARVLLIAALQETDSSKDLHEIFDAKHGYSVGKNRAEK